MKVLIVNETLNLGGAESISVEMANGLYEKGIETYFASAQGILSKHMNKGVHYIELPKFSITSLFQLIFTLEKVMRSIQPDMIHSHGATMAVLSGIALRRAHLKSVNILTHHIIKFSRLPEWLSVYLLNKYCDKIIALSQTKLSELRKSGIFIQKLVLLPNFISFESISNYLKYVEREDILQELNISPQSMVITYIGRLAPEKRIDRYIQILAQYARNSAYKITGLIVGEGPLKHKLMAIAAQYQDRIKIIFTGYQENVFKYLAISHIFLSASQCEVLPKSIIEASAAGVPVVCSDIPGHREIIIEGYNGLLVNDSIADYIQAIEKLLSDQDYFRKISENGKIMAKNRFDIEIVIDKILNYYCLWLENCK